MLRALWFALAIAAFSAVWLVVMTVTGWYRDPGMMEVALAVPIVEVILLVLFSWQARRDGKPLLTRVSLCIAITIVAAILSAGLAYAYTSRQENYFVHVREAHAEGLRQAGRTDAEIAAALANYQLATPRALAMNRLRNTIVYGVIGTLLGVLVTLVLRRQSL